MLTYSSLIRIISPIRYHESYPWINQIIHYRVIAPNTTANPVKRHSNRLLIVIRNESSSSPLKRTGEKVTFSRSIIAVRYDMLVRNINGQCTIHGARNHHKGAAERRNRAEQGRLSRDERYGRLGVVSGCLSRLINARFHGQFRKLESRPWSRDSKTSRAQERPVVLALFLTSLHACPSFRVCFGIGLLPRGWWRVTVLGAGAKSDGGATSSRRWHRRDRVYKRVESEKRITLKGAPPPPSPPRTLLGNATRHLIFV